MNATNKQRAMMAAHVSEVIAYRLRTEGVSLTTREAHARVNLIMLDDPASERWYGECLLMLGSSPADIDAAREAIARGEHPADSLPGMVIEMRGEVAFSGKLRHQGKDAACRRVLKRLGCKVTP